jgi:hypothetical protein
VLAIKAMPSAVAIGIVAEKVENAHLPQAISKFLLF